MGAKAAGRADLDELARASLDELKARYPDEWARTGQALVDALETGHAAGGARFLARARAEAAPLRARVQKSGDNPRVTAAALPVLVRERMAELALREAVNQAAAQHADPGRATDRPSTLRLGWWSGALIQRLFFSHDLVRKPVSPGWFRLLWPLVKDKALLMPLCEPRGIYCFYARPLVTGLGHLIEEVSPGSPALEIAAGDGTLSRFLTAAGVRVHATDDRSWAHAIRFPDEVEAADAGAALVRHAPEVVFCSWPPPGNGFERQVFRTPSVRRYIVLTTRHRFAAGSTAAYDEAAPSFGRRIDVDLTRHLLPPEIDPVVIVFDRKVRTRRPTG